MRKMMIIMVWLSFCACTAGAQDLSSEALLEKSKRKKTIAWSLLGAGGALIGVGAAITPHDNTLNKQSFRGLVPMMLGLGSSIASVPFFIRSGALKRKAKATVYSGIQNINLLAGNARQSVLGMRINFN